MSVLHLRAIRFGELCAVCGSYFVLQRRSTARLFSRTGTGVRSFWLPPCVPVVSSAPVSPSHVCDDQNTLLTIKCSRSYAALSVPQHVSVTYYHEVINSCNTRLSRQESCM